MSYREVPLPINDNLAFMEMLKAFQEAASSLKPQLPVPTYVLFHQLLKARKVAVRIVFGKTEIEDPSQIEPFVRFSQSKTFKINYDYIEVFKDDVLWLIDIEKFEWLTSTDDFIKEPEPSKPNDDGEREIPWYNR